MLKIKGICIMPFATSLFLSVFSISAVNAQAQEKVSPAPKATLDNLQAAYNGEKNANARYLAFAKKADEEGYGQIATLFRATARAEQVHFENHAAAIKMLGHSPKADIQTPVVKSTKENLEAAIKGETYESNTMYPEFLAVAEKENVRDAINAFEDAKAAEAIHAQLYTKALSNMEAWRGSKKLLYVCPTCGNVVEVLPEKTCPICGTEVNKFRLIS